MKDETGDCKVSILLVSCEESFGLDVVMAEGGWGLDLHGLFRGHDG